MRLQEEERTRRRSIADALDVVSCFDMPRDPIGRIRIGPLRLPSGDKVYLVEVVFPQLGIVSLQTSARFKARNKTHSTNEGDIRLLDGADVYSVGTVVLRNGERLRAVEVVPSYLPYKPSPLDLIILHHVLALTDTSHCYRSVLEDLPQQYRGVVLDLRAIDFARVRDLRVPRLKSIKAYIEDKDPALTVSLQKISDALAVFGVRRPRRRRTRTQVRSATI